MDTKTKSRRQTQQNHPQTPSRDDILNAIRAVAEKSADRRIGIRTLLAGTGLKRFHIHKHFGSWKNALSAAGFLPALADHIDTPDLLADWGRVARIAKGAPAYLFYKTHGHYSPATLQHRFGTWNNAALAFKAWAADKPEWNDVAEFCAPRPGRPSSSPTALPAQRAIRTRRKSTGRPLENRVGYGEPLYLPGLRNAPTNENGVVLAFGMLARELGFHVQVVRSAFPDCEALRDVGESWQTVRIEFEYESRNFAEHGHPPAGCDIIVCWRHNWQNCPPHLEVIELSREIARLNSEPQ